MANPLTRFFMARENVQIASTSAELEAIYRLRYDVYVKEKGWVDCGEDHERRRLADTYDATTSARQLYVGALADLKGTARLLVFDAGHVPAKWVDMYGLDRFPGVDRLRVAEVGRFAIRKDCRGGAVMPALILFGFNHLIGPDKVDLIFCECRPSMVRHYRKMGFRPYSAPMIRDADGLQVPLVGVPSDAAYLKSVDAIIRDDAARHFRRGGRPPLDLAPFQHLFAEDNQRVELESHQVLAAVEDSLQAPDAAVSPDELSPEVFEQATKHGYVLKIEPGDLLVEEGRAEREAYLIVSGELEVLSAGHRIRVLGAGHLFGEMAYFLEDGRRTATVRAVSAARVLVLDRRFLDDLHRDAPDAAYRMLHLIGRSLATRLQAATPTLSAAAAAGRP